MAEGTLQMGAGTEPAATRRGPRQFNLALWIGSIVVLAIVGIAIVGPRLAPHDPLQEHLLVQVNGEWIQTPYPPLTVPGFPLGTDELGRDLLSRLMWAVRPTMILVVGAATLRLLLGTALGAVAGWSTRWPGRLVDALIAIALAIPVLIVALAVIAAVSIEIGIWAFVLGLSVTGWAETARIVRDQTAALRGRTFVEAARAVGSSEPQIVGRHVLRQLRPLLWMLFSFEISNTLVLTASLGFLGYFVGGEIWVAISDSAAQRFSGTAELGQMLSGSLSTLYTGPWRPFAAGSMIFLIVLGFNLLGEGLRRRANLEVSGSTLLGRATERLWFWTETRVVEPLDMRYGERPVRLFFAGGLLAILLLAGGWWRMQGRVEAGAGLPVPGDHPWATELRDPFGTMQSTSARVPEPEILWRFQSGSPYSGGPAISENGVIYLANHTGQLYALNDLGAQIWWRMLPEGAVGSPALDTEGSVYLVHRSGALSKFDWAGHDVWRFDGGDGPPASSGPVIAPDGTIFYTRGSEVQAVAPDGHPLWRSAIVDSPTRRPPHLSPDGDWLMLNKAIVRTADGHEGERQMPRGSTQFAIGGDGDLYARTAHGGGVQGLVRWRLSPEGAEVANEINWDDVRRLVSNPIDFGVTSQQILWLAYSFDNLEDAKIAWASSEGRSLGISNFNHRPTRFIGLDRDSQMYACGNSGGELECLAIPPGADVPTWRLHLPRGDEVVGGAVANERLYVATADGTFYALGAK